MMLIRKIFTLAALLCVVNAFAQDAVKTAGTGNVYFIRRTGYNASAITFHCFVDSQLVCNLKNKRFSVHQVATGQHTFTVRTYSKKLGASKNSVTINIEEGKTSYIKLLPEKAYRLQRSDKLLVVSESTAQPILKKCRQEKKCLK